MSERTGLTAEQIEDIRTKWRSIGAAVQAGQPLNEVGLLLWYAEHVGDLLSTTDRLTAALAARDAEVGRLRQALEEAHYQLWAGRADDARAVIERAFPVDSALLAPGAVAHYEVCSGGHDRAQCIKPWHLYQPGSSGAAPADGLIGRDEGDV